MVPQTGCPRVEPGRAGRLPAALLAERGMIREAAPPGEVPRALMAAGLPGVRAGRDVQEGGATADRVVGMEGGAVAVPLYGSRPQGWRMGRAGAGGGAEVVAGAAGPGRTGPKVHISGGERAQSCRELAQSPRVACIFLAIIQDFDSSQALELEQPFGKRTTVQQALNPIDGASNRKKVPMIEQMFFNDKKDGRVPLLQEKSIGGLQQQRTPASRHCTA